MAHATISDLISVLEQFKNQHGDLPLDFDWGTDYSPVLKHQITIQRFMQTDVLLGFGAD